MDGGLAPLDQREGLLGRPGLEDVVALAAEDQVERAADVALVVDDSLIVAPGGAPVPRLSLSENPLGRGRGHAGHLNAQRGTRGAKAREALACRPGFG